jgi:hypothetical protein
MIFFVILVLAVSSLFYYVQAFKSGLSAKSWAVIGLVTGPCALPMFRAKKRMALRRVQGFDSVFFGA